MEEKISEDTADTEEPLQAKMSLEEANEKGDSDETRPNDRERHKFEVSNSNEYRPTRNYTKTEPNSENKKSSGSREESLDKLIESDKDVSFAINEEGDVVPTYKGRMVYGEGSSMPTRFIGKAINKSIPREVHDSFDGAHAIIYHRDPETGKIYFAFEKKPADYPISKYAGTLSLYGGSLKVGEAPNEGLVRELKEEDPDSFKIIIKALNETRWKVAEISSHIDGVPSTTYIWAAEIKDPNTWSDYLLSRSTEGDKTTKSLVETLGMKNSDFAFGFGPVIKGIANVLSENYSRKSNHAYSTNLDLNNKFTPRIYPDSIIPQNFAFSMQLLPSKESRQYKPAILSFNNLN